MPLRCLAGALTALSISIPAIALAQDAAPVVVIGDSLNDTGTFAGVTATGRFTNTPGALWTEIVAHRLGGFAEPAQLYTGEEFVSLGGTNWAQSGALVTQSGGLYNGLSMSVSEQIDAALETQIGPETIVLMDGGGPDVLLSLFLVGEGQMSPEDAFGGVQAAGVALADQAARIEAVGAQVVLLNVGNFGVFPMTMEQGPEVAGFASQLSAAFNASVAARADEINLQAIRVDVFAWTDRVTGDPAAHGLTNLTDPSCDLQLTEETPTRAAANCTIATQVAPDASFTHLFADDLHGSAVAHRLLAETVLAEIGASGLPD